MAPLPQERLDQLWHAFKDNHDQEARAAIIHNFAHLVKITAGRVVTSIPAGMDREDLASAGTIGLLKAVDQFEPNRGVKFETYAIALIRGAILEMLRSDDWVPRSIRDKFKLLERTMIALEARLGRPPTEEELATAMDIQEDELRVLHKKWLTTGIVSTDEFTANIDGEDQIRYIDMIVDENASPEQEFAGNALRENLAASVDKLPDRERLVIALYYYEGLTFKEIGQVLGVSESRVYQLHTQAMGRIKVHMESQGGFYAA